jgi:hypothetical protein
VVPIGEEVGYAMAGAMQDQELRSKGISRKRTK